MQSKIINQQKVLHCSNCGCTFFEENGINRITSSQAEELASNKQTDEVSTLDKNCPRDQTVLSPKENRTDVTLLHCPSCLGILAYPEDLIKFSQAQLAKTNHFKLNEIPFTHLRSIMIVSVVMVISLAGITAFLRYQSQYLAPAQAEDVVQQIHVSSTDRYVFISFRTQTPLVSRIIFNDKTDNRTIEKPITSSPKTLHYLTTTDLDLFHSITYQIVITTQDGREIKSKELIFP